MTHDPLCPSVKTPVHLTNLGIYYGRYRCQCDLIAKVREDAASRVWDYLQHDVADGWMPKAKANSILAAIKGDSDD